MQNHIFKIPNSEGRGEEGVNSIVMSHVNPHTTTKKGRTCTSCHDSEKALGYGIKGGKYFAHQSKTTIVDLRSAEGKV
mgnify:CR=1 FL=1